MVLSVCGVLEGVTGSGVGLGRGEGGGLRRAAVGKGDGILGEE